MEDEIEEKNKTIDCARKLNDEKNDDASTTNTNDAALFKDETPIAPMPIDNLISEKHTDNLRLRVCYKDNIMSNATTLVM